MEKDASAFRFDHVKEIKLGGKMNPSGKRNYTKTMILNSLSKMKI